MTILITSRTTILKERNSSQVVCKAWHMEYHRRRDISVRLRNTKLVGTKTNSTPVLPLVVGVVPHAGQTGKMPTSRSSTETHKWQKLVGSGRLPRWILRSISVSSSLPISARAGRSRTRYLRVPISIVLVPSDLDQPAGVRIGSRSAIGRSLCWA